MPKSAPWALACALVLPSAAPAQTPPRALVFYEVVFDCRLLPDRRVEDCRVAREQPAGQGYGELRRRLVERPDFRVPEALVDTAVGGRIELSIPGVAIPPLPKEPP